jgi:hypothetical protein
MLAVVFFVGFWVLAGFIPPPDPADSAVTVAARFREHATTIRWGLLLSLYAGALCVPWTAAVTVQIRRIEGSFSPLAYANLGLGAALPFEFIVPIYFWQTAAYRADRSPQLVQTLNDLGWLPFTGLVYTIVVQAVVVGIAVLIDKRAVPIFPRWFGYLSLWCAALFCPAGLDVFFKDGPLAWNGLIAWWVLLVAVFVWLATLSTLVLRAISNQEHEQRAAEPNAAVLP